MSHAEYAPRPIPVFTKLAVMLRNLPAVRFVVAKFANLLRSNKTAGEPPLSQFVDASALDAAAGVTESAADVVEVAATREPTAPAPEAIGEVQLSQFVAAPASDEARGVADAAAGFTAIEALGESAAPALERIGEILVSPFVTEAPVEATARVSEAAEIETVGQSEALASDTAGATEVCQFVRPLDEAAGVGEEAAELAEIEAVGDPIALAPEAIAKTQVSRFVGEAPVEDTPGRVETPAGPAAMKAADESTAAAPEANDPSDRENLIRRRWAETGIKMWSGRSALNIQGRAGVLPAEPGETLPRYDTLEYRLISGRIVCEGVVVDPPPLRK